MSESLLDRVASPRAHCERRIQFCRREEANLGAFADGTYLAATERIVLNQVLEILGYPVPPRDEADLRYRGTAAAATLPRRKRGRKIP